ncbi:MAG: XdhC/CoxI family protein [Bacillota bacterium]
MTAEIALKICDLIDADREFELYTLVDGERPGDCALFADGATLYTEPSLSGLFLRARGANPAHGAIASIGGRTILCERIAAAPRLYLCGGGHVAVCVAKVAKLAGFAVTVIDERTDFANRERFPAADEIRNVPYGEGLNAIPDKESPYFVLVTRSHTDDQACLERILNRPAAYIGMIGSGAKIKTIFSHLKEQGFTREQIGPIHAPIGIPIGAKTPEEIAVSIVAEMIQTKNAPGGERGWNAALVRALREHGARGAMCTLVDKRGSTPRGPGARMFVSDGGKLYGTVGGGFGEKTAYDAALNAMRTGARGLYRLAMNEPGAANGCAPENGEIDVLIHPLS